MSEALGDGYEADSVVLQESDVVQAVHEGPAKTVQFPDQQAGELPCPYVRHKAVQPWSAGLGSADGVMVGGYDFPAPAA